MANKKIGLILPGGSIKGAWQAGYVRGLFDSGFRPTDIYGVSAGALNGGLLTDLASRQNSHYGVKPTNTDHLDYPLLGKQLVDFWLNNVKSFESLGKKRNRLKIAWSALFKNYLSVLDMDPMDKLVKDNITRQGLNTSPLTFECQAVNIFSCETEVITQDNPNIIDFILASSRMPMTMPVQWIAGQPYLDGGLRDMAPIKSAIDNGCTDLIVVKPQSPDALGGKFDTKDPFKLATRSLDIVLNETQRNDLERVYIYNDLLTSDAKLTNGLSEKLKGKSYINMYVAEPNVPLDYDITKITLDDVIQMITLGYNQGRKEFKID